jgi:tetratricopeptide (TPR) repeat protein
VSERITKALPFPGVIEDAEFHRNYLSFGSVFYQRGYFEQAEAAFARALSDDPTSAEALYGRGSSLLQLGRTEEARQDFQEATKAKASYPDTLANVWNNLGLLSTREGRIPEAVDYFEKALTISPDHLVALDNLGNAYRVMKRLHEAKRVFEHAVQAGPADADAHYGLAMVYAQTGDTQAAYEHLQRALAIRPDYPEAMNNLGILLLRTDRPDEAVEMFRKCMRVAPGFDQAYLNLAKVYALKGNNADARTVLQQLLSQRPDDEQAQKLLEQLPQ